MAYTKQDLKLDIIKLNAKLEASGSPYKFDSESRYGHSAVEVYKNGVCLHLICMGSAKECKAGMYSWVIDHSSEIILMG